MELIPFDLEKALAGDPVVTRDGREVTEIHYFKTARECKIIAVINGNLRDFYEDVFRLQMTKTDYDLFMKQKESNKLWFNLYSNVENDHVFFIGKGYESKELAIQNSKIISESNVYLKTVCVEV
jgi:hypothetical protein